MIWRQKQRGGDSSTNIQAQIVQYGVSYVDAKQIAMDVFNDNFAKLSQNAHRVAVERADELTLNYLSELHDREPKAIENIEDPGVQSDILEAQSGFAKSGDRDLGEILVDILVDRTARKERNTASLALSAALSTAQRLTGAHFAALSALFVFKQLRMLGVGRPEQVYERTSQYLGPIRDEILSLSQSDVEYLAALGCITISMGSISIHETMQRTYPGLFCEGVDISSAPNELSGAPEDGPESVINMLKGTPAVTRSLRDPTRLQVAAVDEEGLHKLLEDNGLLEREEVLRRALTARPVNGDVIMAELAAYNPRLGEVVEVYNSKSLPNCSNTAIGTAIGHANLRKVTSGAFSSALDVWIS
ncbi:LPO_1073/Vpar_1526 family protein [Streptomyces mangrovisoli]|uniref:LPO_1073/Vpar_1526 family protein n=1 Tax=Streptomyces mangrovisoli TaxID=1428628 RepID=UPI000A4C8AB7|nr:LPO_1073/Vpar_1526 family protein [Streptomyces mangrovisoli]